MARNTYTLDGIPLTDPDGRWFLEKNSGLRLIPAKRMANISYPGVDGDSFLPGAPFLPGGVRVVMYVEGVDHENFMYNVEYINALFLQRHKLLELRHDYDVEGTVSRHAFVKFTSGSGVNILGQGLKAGTIEYMAEIPGVFWRSINTSTSVFNVDTTPDTYVVTALSEGNAPVADSLVRFSGGFSSIEVQDVTTGDRLICNTALASGEHIIVDTMNWTARKVTTDTWDGGTNVDMSVVSNRGYGSMFTLETSRVAEEFLYRAIVKCTNPVGTPQVAIRAKKAWL